MNDDRLRAVYSGDRHFSGEDQPIQGAESVLEYRFARRTADDTEDDTENLRKNT